MTGKRIAGITLDIVIVACTALCLFLLYRQAEAGRFRQALTAAILLPAIALGVYEAVCWSRPALKKKKRNPDISTLVLLGEDDRPIRMWDMTGKVGLIIGKSSGEYQVDVDLDGTDYQSYIDPEHAVLNYQTSGWWLLDTSSRNGVSVIRGGRELLLGHQAPAKLEPGDVICLAKYTRIAVN